MKFFSKSFIILLLLSFLAQNSFAGFQGSSSRSLHPKNERREARSLKMQICPDFTNGTCSAERHCKKAHGPKYLRFYQLREKVREIAKRKKQLEDKAALCRAQMKSSCPHKEANQRPFKSNPSPERMPIQAKKIQMDAALVEALARLQTSNVQNLLRKYGEKGIDIEDFEAAYENEFKAPFLKHVARLSVVLGFCEQVEIFRPNPNKCDIVLRLSSDEFNTTPKTCHQDKSLERKRRLRHLRDFERNLYLGSLG